MNYNNVTVTMPLEELELIRAKLGKSLEESAQIQDALKTVFNIGTNELLDRCREIKDSQSKASIRDMVNRGKF